MTDDDHGSQAAAPVILVCSAEMATAMALHASLARRGARVSGPAATVKLALRLLRRLRPEAAILDIELLDGVCAALAEELSRQGVPFWIMSGLPRPDQLPPAFRGGRWVDSTRSMEDVLMEVERSLPRRGGPRETLEIAQPCPACFRLNRLVVSRGLETAVLVCSGCGARLGRVGELETRAAGQAGSEAS